MQTRRLGKTGLQVSEIGFGGEWLERHPEQAGIDLIHYASAQGINILDCWMADPKSRDIIGKGIQDNRSRWYIQGHIGSAWKDGQYFRTRDMRYVRPAFEDLLARLQTDYIDLMLLHQPFCDRYGAYRALEEAYKKGKLRAIGVSNFYPDHFIDIASNMEIVPAVNQVETHVFDQQIEAQKIMEEFGTRIMSWGPLAEGRNGFFTNPTLAGIGHKYGKSVAQIALRWLIQRGVIIIPKSTHIERMRQNIDILDFSLSDEDMAAVATLDTGKSLFFDHHDAETARMFMGWR